MNMSVESSVLFEANRSSALPPAPYPGLRPFAREEWQIFFGREVMVDEVIRRLIQHRLLVVHGDSGAGKSSLIYAGVLPVLEQRAEVSIYRWRTCHAMPGEQPIENIASALCGLLPDPHDKEMRFNIRRAFSFGRDAAPEVARWVRAGSEDQICLLLDQFEELFTQAPRGGPQEVRQVIDFLIGLYEADVEGLHVVVTMRSEFLGSCAQYKDFAETVNATQYLLPRLKHADLLRAIREPARLYDGEVERALAESLIDETGDTPDQLPLIQHGLMRLYLKRMDGVATTAGAEVAGEKSTTLLWRITLDQYRNGRRSLRQILSDHADAVLDATKGKVFPDRREPHVVEQIFRAITKKNADGSAVRHRQTLAQLATITGERADELQAVLRYFRAEGVSLLRPYGARPLLPDESVDISHEALIRSWEKISRPTKGWLDMEFDDGLSWQTLIRQVRDLRTSRSNLLTPGVAEDRKALILRHTRAWSERYGGHWDEVNELVSTSMRAGKTAAQQRVALWVVPVVILAIAAVLFTINLRAREALVQANSLFEQRELARAAADLAREATREKEAVEAEKEERLTEIRSAAQVALEQPALPAGVRQQLKDIEQSTSASAGETTSAERNIAPRVYFFISNESQRTAAEELAKKLPGFSIGSRAVVVPNISVRRSRTNALRCFSEEDCKEARALFEGVRELVTSPVLEVQNQSEEVRSGELPTTRPRHYELWFQPGSITVSEASAQK